MRLHADYEVEQFFSLDDLGCGLTADRGLDHCLDVGNIDAIPRNLLAVHVDQQVRLPKFPHHRQLGETRNTLAKHS